MKFELLPRIHSPLDLRELSSQQLLQLADEIREALCNLVQERSAHFASNLGVVELCLALHLVYDFSKDRLIWDTGHQIYPHKLITGRFSQFSSIRTKGGLMGFPNPHESPYDLFMTGHAGASVSTVLGMKAADDLMGESSRKSVAVIGDGALPSGVVFEAMNNAAETTGQLTVMLNKVPMVGKPSADAIAQFKDALKGFLHGGKLFEDMGFRYIGPVDGHDLLGLISAIEMVKEVSGPVLLHVFTQKGHGFEPACEDPVMYHAPPPFARNQNNEVISIKKSSTRAYTNAMSDAIYDAMQRDPKVCVLTAAMCEGNKLGRVRNEFSERFFDTGICEAHTVAFAGGMAKSGMRPIVNIYSTFLQRSFDHIFQEVALQNLPVTFCLDRGGFAGPDGPTHHGVFDNTYMRVFPNMTVMAPGDELDVAPMLEFALTHNGPTSIRYPKANVETVERQETPIEHGKAEVLKWGVDGMFVAFGSLFTTCVAAAERLREEGLDVGVINARFAKPIDRATLYRAIDETGFVITVEESSICGGFGAAVLEAANADGISTSHVKCLGVPDRFIEHGEREELLADIGLDVEGLVATALAMADRGTFVETAE